MKSRLIIPAETARVVRMKKRSRLYWKKYHQADQGAGFGFMAFASGEVCWTAFFSVTFEMPTKLILKRLIWSRCVNALDFPLEIRES